MADEAREAPEENEEPEQTFYVAFRATGAVFIKAHNAEEAEELANEHFGILQLEQTGCIEDLEYGYRYGPDTEPCPNDEATPIPGDLRTVPAEEKPLSASPQ